ncbi:hypothetical protein [Thiohalophilus sp.]|uniref:hypothetical protein n=1 Tax=Thiohalophilus sp. TaxID=3028392 RepID=UPI002ACDFA59|nr:hypothetical protein [Thiohalophilus sp.]MDZ7661216.1 hypothetical protein [Thiohalophilus sp.]
MNSWLPDYARPLILRFWEICLLRKGPADIPYSPPLLVLLLVTGYFLDNLRINLLLPEITAFQLAGILLVHTLFMVLITAGLLFLFGYGARIVQTLTAFTGTGIILSVLILPFDYITSLNPEKFTMVALIVMAVQIWSLVIAGHILSHALSVHRLTGVIIAIGYLILGLAAFEYLLPVTD